jgi:dynein regulatory complex subunit 2
MPKAKEPLDPIEIEKERIRQAEQRRRQEVLIAARLQEMLEEEQSMSAENLHHIRCRWVTALRASKHKELTNDIEILRHEFEKALDRKNANIAMLLGDLEESEEQYRLALRTHITNVESLIELQKQRIGDMDRHFEEELARMKRDHDLERAEIIRRNDLEKADVKLILENLRVEAEKENNALEEEQREVHDTAVERMDEEKKAMIKEHELNVNRLRQLISNHYSDYNNTAELSIKEYNELYQQDQNADLEIAGQMRNIQSLQERIATWKANLASNSRECEERNAAMQAERDAIAKHFKALKAKMTTWRKQQEQYLSELVTSAHGAEDQLKKHAAGAERILRLVDLCRQLETDREKILRFDADISADDVSEDVAKRVQKYAEAVQQQQQNEDGSPGAMSSADVAANLMLGPAQGGANADGTSRTADGGMLTAAAAEEWKLLERFWIRYNRVVLDSAAISQERFHLQNENAKLRQLLKQYLDGISVNQEVMTNPNGNNLLVPSQMMTAANAQRFATNNQPIQGHGVSAGARGMTNGGRVPVIDGQKVMVEAARQRGR